MSNANDLRVAIVQTPPVFLNLEKSIERALGLIEEGAKQGARVIAFPETWLTGYPVWIDSAPDAALWGQKGAKQLYSLLRQNSATVPDERLNVLLDAAKRAEAWVVIGLHELAGGTLYNTMLTLDPDGESGAVHRKLVPTYGERLIWGRGDGSTLEAVETEFGVLGGLICWEHWMPEARAAMHAQGEALHIAMWPGVPDMHAVASRHYAFEGQCFVLAAGTMLTKEDVLAGFDSLGVDRPEARKLLESMRTDDEGRLYRGQSQVIAPNGVVIAGPLDGETGLLVADLDLNLIDEGHLTLDTAGHYSRPDVFQLHVNTQPQEGVVWHGGEGHEGHEHHHHDHDHGEDSGVEEKNE